MEHISNENLKRFHFDKGFFEAPKQYGHLLLFQAGDISCKGGYRIAEHMQLCYELSFIVAGKGKFITNGVEQEVREGMLCLNLPGQVHQGIADTFDPFRFYYIGFDFMLDGGVRNDYLSIKAALDRIGKHSIKEDRSIQFFFANLLNELLNPTEHSVQMVNLYLQQIVIIAYRLLVDNKNFRAPLGQKVDNTKQIVYQIINYIDTNISSLGELSMLSDALGYSHSYLSHMFTKAAGQSIQSYFSQRRLEKSKEMLLFNGVKITEIAESLNYGSVHAFSKAFKAYYGVSPSRYASENKQK